MKAESTGIAMPWKATLCLTYLCNLRCGFCHIWERRPEGELSFEEWDRVLVRAPRFLWVDLTGGEPLVRPDFPRILDAVIVRHRPLVVHFPTNGSFPARLPELASRVRGSRLVVTVSIDGPPAVHDRMRGVEGSFARAVESLRTLRTLPGVRSAAGMTLTSENEQEVGATLAALRREIPGFREADLHLNFAQVSAHYYGNSRDDFREAGALPPSRLEAWPPSALAQTWLERRYRALLPRFLATRRSPLPCRSLTASVFIGPKGDVHPCITDSRTVGNLRAHNYDLRALLASPSGRELRAAIVRGDCPHCWTPCEAFPTLIDHLPGARALLRSASLLSPPREPS